MSVYSVARARQFIDWYVNEALSPLVLECETIDRVEASLEDEASREQYRRELVFMVLRRILRNDSLLVQYAGNMPSRTWQEALDRVAALRKSGHLPEIAYPASADWVLLHMYASIFVIEQYAYEDFVRPREGDVFLDCGACCGETAIWALYRGAGHVYAFEPNPEATPWLIANAAHFGEGRITLVPVGVGASTARKGLAGEAGNIGGTRLIEAAEGENSVPVIALDDWCRENSIKPDFIKMDIEGAEPDAIRGAAKVISEHRPRLAICLYHRLSDMWVIPDMLKKLVPEYRFWCRKNAIAVEFVLYASV
jgi:FkbM family methyltransferase